jgi:hypothetical protein
MGFLCKTYLATVHHRQEHLILYLPDNNIFAVPAGTYGPTVSDGYYLILKPLTKGQHTIEFAGSIPNPNAPFGSVEINVEYTLNIS